VIGKSGSIHDISAVAGEDLSWVSRGSWQWPVARCEPGNGISDSVDEAEFIELPELCRASRGTRVTFSLPVGSPGGYQDTGIMNCQAINFWD